MSDLRVSVMPSFFCDYKKDMCVLTIYKDEETIIRNFETSIIVTDYYRVYVPGYVNLRRVQSYGQTWTERIEGRHIDMSNPDDKALVHFLLKYPDDKGEIAREFICNGNNWGKFFIYNTEEPPKYVDHVDRVIAFIHCSSVKTDKLIKD